MKISHEIETEAEVHFAYSDPLIRLFATLDQKHKVSTSVQRFPPQQVSLFLTLVLVCAGQTGGRSKGFPKFAGTD